MPPTGRGAACSTPSSGVEPGPALRDLERKILQHDPSLGPSEGPPLRIVGGGRRRRRLLLAAAVAASIAVVAGVVALATRGGSRANAAVIVYPHSVALIDPSTARLAGDVLVGGYPTALTADDRYVYVANAGDATVSRIDPKSRSVFDTFGLSRAIDLYADNGHLWAADGGAPGHTPLGVGPGTVLDLGPGPTLETYRVGPSMNGSEQQTTLAADGPDPYSIWVGNEDSATIRQIDASLGKTLLTIRGVAPGGLAVVGNSSGDTVWASDTGRNVVERIDEHARRVVRRIPVPGGPTRIAADSAAVWVITSRGQPALLRIDPRTNRVVARIPLGITPKRVALGAGSVWVTGYRWSDHVRRSRDGTVLRIDPGTSRIVDRIRLGDVAADGVVVSHGLVWVGVPPSA